MVFYLDFYEELGIYFYCLEFNISIYNLRYVRYGKCFFVCYLCCSRYFGFFFVYLCIFCFLFELEKLDYCFFCILVVIYL